MRLENKIAIVTGAGSGFGKGIAERFVAEGASVVVNDIDTDAGATVAASLGVERALFHSADVSKSDAVAGLVEAAIGRFGALDIFVNNAGVAHRRRPMLEVDEATFDRIFAVNVKAIYLSALHAAPVFRERGGGVFINVASIAGVRPPPGLTWYNGSKGAAITLTKSMAVELAPDRIRVCAINPGLGETGLMETFMGLPDTPENRTRFEEKIPLGRLVQPRDVANAAVFLAADASDALTGVCLAVDGGRSV